jgi:uncharacterized coiled-coil DUF342 family protein
MAETDTLTLLRQRFAELCAERDAIQAMVAPLREQRDALLAKAAKAAAGVPALEAQISAAEAPLYELNNSIAQLSRALGGMTGG